MERNTCHLEQIGKGDIAFQWFCYVLQSTNISPEFNGKVLIMNRAIVTGDVLQKVLLCRLINTTSLARTNIFVTNLDFKAFWSV